MKPLLFLSFVLALPLGLFCQTTLDSSCNLPRPGDRLAKQQVDYKAPGAAGADLVWDFSDQTPLNDHYELKYRTLNTCSDALVGIEDRTMYYYHLRGDSLCSLGYENPTTLIRYRWPEALLVFPFAYGRTLGLGGKETLTYENGNLFNADGSAYAGKVNGYLKSVVGALGSLNATTEGVALVSELQNSTNMFTIKSGDNAFVPNSPTKAGVNLAEVQAATGNMVGSSGSGGTIYWNKNSTSGGLDFTGSISCPAYVGLGHEMGHASDSNWGLLHFSNDYTNAVTGTTYYSAYNGLLKSEWRAVYRENIIRGQAGIPLRTHYGINISTGIPVGIRPKLITPTNRPINYP